MSRPILQQCAAALVIASSLLIGGCAGTAVNPQLFPTPVATSSEEHEFPDSQHECAAYGRARDAARHDAALWPFDGQRRLCIARLRADLLREKYVGAVAKQSAEGNVLNTVLLGIGGVAGYHLLRNGLTANLSTLRYLAAGGGALYGYTTLTQSQARQVVYLTGAEALTCIHAASGELQVSPEELRTIVDADAELRSSTEYMRLRLAQAFEEDHGRPGRCKTKTAGPDPCHVGVTGVGQMLFDAAPPKGCGKRAAVRTCDDSLARAASALEAEISDADELHSRVAMRLSELERLSGRVRAATDSVSYAISREVLKTEASSSTVLNTIEGMRGVVAQLTGTAQSGFPQALVEDGRARHPMLEGALHRLRNAKARVREHDRTLAARLKAFPEKIGLCQGLDTMARISVEPNLEQVVLVPDRPFTVLATGSSATPSANLLGDPDNALTFQSKVNGKQLETVVTLKKADRNVAASLQFSAPGAVSVVIPLIYVKQAIR